MTAIITLVGTDDGFKVVRPLLFELFTYIRSQVVIFVILMSINFDKSYQNMLAFSLEAIEIKSY